MNNRPIICKSTIGQPIILLVIFIFLVGIATAEDEPGSLSGPTIICTKYTRNGSIPIMTPTPNPTITPIPSPTITPMPSPTPTEPGILTECWGNDCDLRFGPYILHNNMWGARNDVIRQGVYYYSDGRFGWEWDRPNPQLSDCGQYICPTYPEVIVGPPIEYKNINSWTSEVDYRWAIQPSGSYNLAYDIYWFDPSNTEYKTFNVMIWIDGYHDDTPVGTVSDGINTYDHFYRGPNSWQYWPWHAFVLKNQGSTSITINVKALLDQISGIDGNWIIDDVELGSEIWDGSGKIEISKFVNYINGNRYE